MRDISIETVANAGPETTSRAGPEQTESLHLKQRRHTPQTNLLCSSSIEVTSREPKAIDACQARLEPGTHVYLAWIPGDDPLKTVAAAAALRRSGLVPVPHIGARHLESTAQLSDLIVRLAGEGQVENVLVVAGDRDRPAGPYASSLQVMETGILQKNGIHDVGISGFPEGNPKISDQEVQKALSDKATWSRRTGVKLHIVSQFCFDASAILAWVRSLRAAGIAAPVRIGLAGPASIATLTRYAIRCGVRNSVRAIARGPSLGRLLTDGSPEPIVNELAIAASADSALDIIGLHFFAFGGFDKAVNFIHGLRSRAQS